MTALIKNITELFIGPNSKKRQLGIGVALGLSILYYVGLIPLELYEALMPFVIIFTGAAFSARLTKLQNTFKNLKQK